MLRPVYHSRMVVLFVAFVDHNVEHYSFQPVLPVIKSFMLARYCSLWIPIGIFLALGVPFAVAFCKENTWLSKYGCYGFYVCLIIL